MPASSDPPVNDTELPLSGAERGPGAVGEGDPMVGMIEVSLTLSAAFINSESGSQARRKHCYCLSCRFNSTETHQNSLR